MGFWDWIRRRPPVIDYGEAWPEDDLWFEEDYDFDGLSHDVERLFYLLDELAEQLGYERNEDDEWVNIQADE